MTPSPLATILALRLRAEAVQDPAFRKACGTLIPDLVRIEAVLADDPDAFRARRAFFLVHAPALIDAIGLYGKVKATGSEKDADLFLSRLAQACVPAREAREALDESVVSGAMIAIEVLNEKAGIPALAPAPVAEPKGWGFGAAKRAVSSGLGAVSGAATYATRATQATGGLLAGVFDTGTEFLGRTIKDPVMIRIAAAEKAAGSAASEGLVAGLIFGILCPPLLPFTGGVAALAAITAWNEEVDRQSGLVGAERDRKMAEIQRARREAIMAFTGGQAAARSETAEISFIVDGETGAADATLLSGPKMGEAWSSLSEKDRAAELARLQAAGAAQSLVILSAISVLGSPKGK